MVYIHDEILELFSSRSERPRAAIADVSPFKKSLHEKEKSRDVWKQRFASKKPQTRPSGVAV